MALYTMGRRSLINARTNADALVQPQRWHFPHHFTLPAFSTPSLASLETLRSTPSGLRVSARQEPWETKFISHVGKLRPRKKSPGKAEMTLGPILALLLFIHGSTYGTSQRVISVQNRKGQQRSLWATVTATLLVSFPSLIVWVIPLYNHPPHSAQSTDLGVQGNRFAWLISYLLSCPAGLEMANK